MSIGKILAVIFGALLLLMAAAFIAGAFTIANADQDVDDFFVSEANRLETGSYAIVVDSVVVDEAPSWVFDRLTDVLDVRIAATSSAGAFSSVKSPGSPIFSIRDRQITRPKPVPVLFVEK